MHGTAESTVTQTADRPTNPPAEYGKQMYYVGLIRSGENRVGRSWNARVVQMLFRARSYTRKRTPVPGAQYRPILLA
jgi:hypothetical protein